MLIQKVQWKWSLLFGVSLFILGCSKELPNLTATSVTQLTEQLVLHASLSSDTKQAFILSRGPIFSHWDIASNRVLNVIDATELPANTRRFVVSENGSRLLTSDGKSILLWQMADFELLGSLDFSQHLGDANITAMAFISDTEFVVGNSDGSFIFADLTNQVFRRSQFHTNEVNKLLVDEHKTLLFSAGNDGRVMVTDLQLYTQVSEYSTPFRITSLISNHDNSVLFLSDALDQQVFWRPNKNPSTTDAVVGRLDFFEQYRFFRLGMFMNDDRQLLTTSPKTELSIWDTNSGEELARWLATSQSLGSTILDLGLDDRQRLITITSDAVVEAWDLSQLSY